MVKYDVSVLDSQGDYHQFSNVDYSLVGSYVRITDGEEVNSSVLVPESAKFIYTHYIFFMPVSVSAIPHKYIKEEDIPF